MKNIILPPHGDNKSKKLPEDRRFLAQKENFSTEELLKKEEIKEKILKGEDIRTYLSSTSREVFQSALKEGVMELVWKSESVDELYLYLIDEDTKKEIKSDLNFQKIIEKEIKNCLHRFWNVSYVYIFLASEEVINQIKADGQYQDLIEMGVKERISSRASIDAYLYLMSQETIEKIKENREIQDQIENAIKKQISEGLRINPAYMSLISKMTLEEIEEDQQLVKKGTIIRASKGYSFYDYYNFLSPQSRKELFEDERKIKRIVRKLILTFFTHSPMEFNVLGELEKIIDGVISFKSKEYLLKSIFDKTFVPLGLKFHTKEKYEVLDNYFKRTAFIAHRYKQCYVIEHPFPNPYSLELFFLTLKSILDKKQQPLEEDMYIQAYFPERLSNEMCGILAISFLLTREKNLKFTPDLLKFSQNKIGITIYDGGIFIFSGEHTFFDEKGKPFNLNVDGSTDLLFCSSLKDLMIAQTVYTLLLHKEKQMFFNRLGGEFIEEFKRILSKHKKEQWLNNKFIELKEEKEISQLAKLLLEINEEKEAISKKIKKYNEGLEYYKQEEDSYINQVTLNQLKEEFNKEIKESIYFEMKNLVEKYYNEMVAAGLAETSAETSK